MLLLFEGEKSLLVVVLVIPPLRFVGSDLSPLPSATTAAVVVVVVVVAIAIAIAYSYCFCCR